MLEFFEVEIGVMKKEIRDRNRIGSSRKKNFGVGVRFRNQKSWLRRSLYSTIQPHSCSPPPAVLSPVSAAEHMNS
jgi:hypothetical protein